MHYRIATEDGFPHHHHVTMTTGTVEMEAAHAHVIVVEQHRAFRDVLSLYLTLEGYVPLLFHAIEEAIHSPYLDQTRVGDPSTRPACLLADFPVDEDGQGVVVRAIKALFSTLDIPLLLMSLLPYPELITALHRWGLPHIVAVEKIEGVGHVVTTMEQMIASSLT